MIPENFFRTNRLILAVEAYFWVGSAFRVFFWGITLYISGGGRMIPKKLFPSKSADFCCGGVFWGLEHDFSGFLGYNTQI